MHYVEKNAAQVISTGSNSKFTTTKYKET